jgi:cytochrome c-type biogenesis protein CcmH
VRRAALLALAALALVAAAPQTTLNDVEDEVMCDTCNVPLNIAESPRADQERREIRDLIAQGLTKQQILDRLEQRYGPTILASPKKGGAAVALWAVPAVALVAVLALLLVALPRWRRRRAAQVAATAPEPELAPADARRLEQDLARYDL